MKMLRHIAVCALVLLAGCSTTAIDVDKAPRADASAVLDPALTSPALDRGTVRIARDGGVLGHDQTVLVYLDSRHVANITARRVLELYVPAAAPNLGVQAGHATRPIRYVDVTVQAGRVPAFRLSRAGRASCRAQVGPDV